MNIFLCRPTIVLSFPQLLVLPNHSIEQFFSGYDILGIRVPDREHV